MNKRVAAIDLGTNTVRLIVAEGRPGSYTTLYSNQAITRLGQGLHETGALAPQAIERTVGAIAAMLDEAAPHKPFAIHAAATSAAREAGNTAELDRALRERAGCGLTVIPWENEARLALKGARLAPGAANGRILLFDIGGGSTEFILGAGDSVAGAYGTDLGVVRLAETYLTRHPVIPGEVERMAAEARRKIDEAVSALPLDGSETLVGTAGTVTALAAIDLGLDQFDPEKVNGHRLTLGAVKRMGEWLMGMTLAERGRIPGLSGGREDLIVPGVVIVEETMRRAGKDWMLVSDYGLREGLLLEMLEA